MKTHLFSLKIFVLQFLFLVLVFANQGEARAQSTGKSGGAFNKSSAKIGKAYPARFNPNTPYMFSGLDSRSVTQENPTGEKGVGGKDKGNGNLRKGAPAFRDIQPGETKILCDIEGPGMIRHFWLTPGQYFEGVKGRQWSPEMNRSCILRIYWDDSPYPSVECPLGDFFGVAHGRTAHYMTPFLGMPEGRGFQCYFPMPFSKRCRIEFVNDSPEMITWLFYQVDYTLGDIVTEDMGRFHAQFRRETPPVGKDYVLLDTKGTPGVFMGAVIGVNPLAPGWWGEGEMKFYIDGDEQYPTICGTGAEDYLCSAWGMDLHQAIYTGVNYIKTDPETSWKRFISFYRFHVYDPIFFQQDLRVELQQLGAGALTEENKIKYGFVGPHIHPGMSDWLYDRSDDYSSVVFWYQKVTGQPLTPALPDRQTRIKGIAKQPWETTQKDAM
jgi:hypothetical protein